jgi:hypothetical protein
VRRQPGYVPLFGAAAHPRSDARATGPTLRSITAPQPPKPRAGPPCWFLHAACTDRTAAQPCAQLAPPPPPARLAAGWRRMCLGGLPLPACKHWRCFDTLGSGPAAGHCGCQAITLCSGPYVRTGVLLCRSDACESHCDCRGTPNESEGSLAPSGVAGAAPAVAAVVGARAQLQAGRCWTRLWWRGPASNAAWGAGGVWEEPCHSGMERVIPSHALGGTCPM